MTAPGPIFVLGVTPRSGTNLLWDLLRLHPDCAPAREPIWEDALLVHADLLGAYADRTAAAWHDAGAHRAELRAELLASVGAGLTSFLATDPGRRLLTKTPHVHGLHRFFDLFPDASLVLLVRDGRAVAQSAVDTFGGTIEGWARHWAEAVDAVLRFDREHRNAGLPYTLVRYEDFLDDREGRLRELLPALSLDATRYDFDEARRLPVRGSSVLRRDGRIDWEPAEPGPDFDPKARFASWGRRTHRRFHWIAGRQLDALGYGSEHAARLGVGRAGQRLRDLLWAVARPLRGARVRRRTGVPFLRGRVRA